MNKQVSAHYKNCQLKYFENCGVREDYPRRSIIETGGQQVQFVYFILRGRIRQYFIDHNGSEKTLLLLSSGDLFGEITALQQDNDQVITETLTATAVRRIPVSRFLQMLETHPDLSFSAALMLTHKIRILMAQLQDSSFCDTQDRLKNLLIRLSQQQGVSTPDGIRLPHKYTQEELAGMISSTRSTVSRKLKRLAEEGFIRINGRHIYLLIPEPEADTPERPL